MEVEEGVDGVLGSHWDPAAARGRQSEEGGDDRSGEDSKPASTVLERAIMGD